MQWYYNFRGTYRDYLWIHRDREMMRYLAKNCEKNATVYQNFVSWEQNVEMVLQLDHFMGRRDLIFLNALPSQCLPYGRTHYTLGCYLDDNSKDFNYILVDNAWERFKKPIKPINKNYTVVFENKNWSIYKKQA